MNPSMYGSYQNNNQQQWPTQQGQLQQNQYYDTDQYQQQELQQRQFEGPTTALEPVVPPPLPPGWSEHIDPSSGRPYYYNSNDGSTTWDRPPTLPAANQTTSDNDGMHQQQFEMDQSYSPALQEHLNNTDSQEDLLRQDTGSIDTHDHSKQESLAIPNEPLNSSPTDGDALTSIRREDNKIIEEEHWREAQGWNSPTDKAEGSHHLNTGVQNDAPKTQQSQGWNLPPPQNQVNHGWGIVETPPPENSERAPMNLEQQTMLQSRQADPYRRSDETIPTPNQVQHQKQQLYAESKFTQANNIPSNIGNVPPNLQRSMDGDSGKPEQPTHQHRGPASNAPIEQVTTPANIDGKNPHQVPQHHRNQPDTSRYVQQPPPTAFSRPPPTQVYPYQYSQQRPGTAGQQSYPPHQGGNIYSQQPQNQDGGQYRQIPQYPGRPMHNQYPPPTHASPQQSYSSQAAGQPGGQLITQEQQNLVKESLGRTWQSILGLKDKTKEVVETATSTVAQSARDATQTIAEKGTGWWGQAKSVIGSVFESEPTQEYSLSGIYGNAPPAPTKQDPSRNYAINQNYPPQSRYYPPQGPGSHQLPPQGRYPPGYGPPQPRVDTPYPYQPQEARQAIPPIQRQLDSNPPPQQGYPQQHRPFDPSRNEYSQPTRPGQQVPPSQQPRNPEDSSSAWAHPGLTSDY